MLVPAAVNGAWGADQLRSVDLFPSILRSLGKPIPTAAIDGARGPDQRLRTGSGSGLGKPC